jgi:hypothetical protein
MDPEICEGFINKKEDYKWTTFGDTFMIDRRKIELNLLQFK